MALDLISRQFFTKLHVQRQQDLIRSEMERQRPPEALHVPIAGGNPANARHRLRIRTLADQQFARFQDQDQHQFHEPDSPHVVSMHRI